MGGHDEWIALLRYWFPHCFTHEIPPGTRFDGGIIDFTQFQAIIKNMSGAFDAHAACIRCVNTAHDYMNNTDSPDRPIFDKAIILLSDSVRHVPKAKATVQQTRDDETPQEEEEEEEAKESVEVDVPKTPNDTTAVFLDDRQYEQLINDLGIEYDDYIIHREMRRCEWLTGLQVWRNYNLRWQYNTMIALEVLNRCDVPRGKVLVFDDAVLYDTPEAYKAVRERILGDFKFHDRTPLERDALVSYMLETTSARRHLKHSDGMATREAATGVGEADAKICNYIQLDNGLESYLVCSQDSDTTIYALLHLKRLLEADPEKAGRVRIHVDTQTPQDRSKGINRLHRFINIVDLYHSLVALFAREYPSVVFPIETFCFLVNSLETDFTVRLGQTYNGVTRRVLWDTFSELHHDRATSRNDGYLVMPTAETMKKTRQPNEPLARRKVAHHSQKIHYVLGGDDAIRCETHEIDERDPSVLEYRIVLNETKVERFYYLLMQVRLVKDMQELKAPLPNQPMRVGGTRGVKDTLLPYYETPSVLFVCANDILRAIEAYRRRKDLEFINTVKTLVPTTETEEKKPQAKHLLPSSKQQQQQQGKKPLRPMSAIMADIGPTISHAPTEKQYDEKAMSKLATKHIPADYGLLTRVQMRGRIRRCTWILNYMQNATVCNAFATCYKSVERRPKSGDASGESPLSFYGWRTRDIKTQSTRDLNCSYYECRLISVPLGEVPLRISIVEETDDVVPSLM